MIHVAGPYVSKVQHCLRCGIILTDNRQSDTHSAWKMGTFVDITKDSAGSSAGITSQPPTCDMSASQQMYEHAYLGGTFDCLHRGHIALFAAARKIAKELTVSVNTDDFAQRYKRLPLMPLADRLMVLSQMRLVDHVMINTGDEDSKPCILRSRADCVVHGSDWSGDALMQQMNINATWLTEHNIDFVILPYTDFISTTKLLKNYEGHEGLRHEDLRTSRVG